LGLIRPLASCGRRRDCLLFWLAVAITFGGHSPLWVTGGCRRQVGGTAGLPPAPEMPCAPRQLRLVPLPDILTDSRSDQHQDQTGMTFNRLTRSPRRCDRAGVIGIAVNRSLRSRITRSVASRGRDPRTDRRPAFRELECAGDQIDRANSIRYSRSDFVPWSNSFC
jgi:hypothetical protein